MKRLRCSGYSPGRRVESPVHLPYNEMQQRRKSVPVRSTGWANPIDWLESAATSCQPPRPRSLYFLDQMRTDGRCHTVSGLEPIWNIRAYDMIDNKICFQISFIWSMPDRNCPSRKVSRSVDNAKYSSTSTFAAAIRDAHSDTLLGSKVMISFDIARIESPNAVYRSGRSKNTISKVSVSPLWFPTFRAAMAASMLWMHRPGLVFPKDSGIKYQFYSNKWNIRVGI